MLLVESNKMLKRTHLADLNYSIVNIFPSPIHQIDVKGFDEIQNELIDYAYSKRKLDSEGVHFSNRQGWQSQGFNIENQDDVLHSFLTNCLVNFPPLKKSRSSNMVVDAWININEPDSYNVKHNHPCTDLAGVLWIKCPKDCGEIVFDNPTLFQSHNEIGSYNEDFKNEFNIHHHYYFPPSEGEMIIFPSHLNHSVNKNKSKEDRISVAFNIRLPD